MRTQEDPFMSDFPEEVERQPFDLKRACQLVLRRFWLVVLIASFAGIGTRAYLKGLPMIYSASAVLLVEKGARRFANITAVSQVDFTSSELLNTAVEILKSRALALRVASSEKIKQIPQSGFKLGEDTPSQLQNMISVSRRPGTRLIDITVDSQNPDTAKQLASLFLDEFIRMSFEQKLVISKVANTYLSEEADRLKKELEASETALHQYTEANESVSLQDDQNIIVEQLKDLNARVTGIRSERLSIEADIEQLATIDRSDLTQMLRIASVANLPEVSGAREAVTAKESEFLAMKERYLPKHPKYIEVASELAAARNALTDAVAKAGTILRRSYDKARQTESKMVAELQAAEKRALELNRIAIPYNVYLREVESDRALYDSIVKRLKETSMQQGVDELPYRIVEEPFLSPSPAKPNKRKTMIVVLVISMLGTIGLILGLDHLDPGFKTAGQLEHILQQPVLGTVPKVSARLLKKSPMVVVEHPESTAAEAFRSLRATLSLFGREENRKLFLVTSALPFEGKSFVSVNLAAAFAQQGLRTLLIDADLRCPTIQAAVLGDKLPQQPGLADYLSGHIDIEDAMWQTSLDSLAVIPAGGRSPFPAELLGQPEFADMLAVMATLFDRVVIDSPPITPVSDSLLIAPHVHGICLVARASKSPRKSTEQALKLLLQVKGTVVGTVMNGVTDMGKASHYYKNYGLVAEPARTPVHTC